MPHAFFLLSDTHAIARLDADADVPGWAMRAQGFVSITRTAYELSIVCANDAIPADVRADRDWRAIRLEGTFAFDETGVLASIAAPLAQARVGVFAISTFDTDYILFKTHDCERALDSLRAAGHRLVERPDAQAAPPR